MAVGAYMIQVTRAGRVLYAVGPYSVGDKDENGVPEVPHRLCEDALTVQYTLLEAAIPAGVHGNYRVELVPCTQIDELDDVLRSIDQLGRQIQGVD